MNIEEIKQQLCVYDSRNPDYDKDYPKKDKHKECYCDACFYGRHYLADKMLLMFDELEETRRVLFADWRENEIKDWLSDSEFRG